jgi:hypothetical protein
LGESLPGNRVELHARLVSRMLSRDTEERWLGANLPYGVKGQAVT